MSPMITCLVVLMAAAVVTVESAVTYDTKYDKIDVDKVLANDRLRKNAVSCLVDNTSCTPEVRLLKKFLPDALKNACASCSEAQKEGAEKVFKYLIENHPEEYKRVANKYDPEGVYIKKYKGVTVAAKV